MRKLRLYLRDLDGKPFGQLRKLSGTHPDRDLSLSIDHIQGDPYAPASRMRLDLHPSFHPNMVLPADPFERLALEDLFLREFSARLPSESLPAGDGPGGRVRTVRPDETIRPRSACACGRSLTLRFSFSFPAQGRRILSEPAAAVLADRVPALALEIAGGLPPEKVRELAEHLRKRDRVRRAMDARGFAAFLPQGSATHRQADGRPPPGAVRLRVPQGLVSTLALADGSSLEGLAIPRGITVVVGSAFHGKTTFLEALGKAASELGPKDGLALACSAVGTESVTVEEDRAVSFCDLSPFFRRLPGQDPSEFSVDEASGATSQAANLHEALATGARLLLVDEDASAANFLTRDRRISLLLPTGESVVPLVARARELAQRGISMVVVAGASSEWLSVADLVLVMADFQPSDATAKAREVAPEAPASVPAARWDAVLVDTPMDRWKDLAGLADSKIRVQDGRVRLAGSAESLFPRRFADDDALRGAAHFLCEWLRQCRDRGHPATRDGMLAFLKAKHAQPDPWTAQVGHDLSFPQPRTVWGLWTRLRAGKGATESEEG
ncbi:MAG TPA: P-loop domain-containing protein [Fibrobacteria bacterium]|nr:P-loop domain-containing protein [Fibrobacteria bacterium]